MEMNLACLFASFSQKITRAKCIFVSFPKINMKYIFIKFLLWYIYIFSLWFEEQGIGSSLHKIYLESEKFC